MVSRLFQTFKSKAWRTWIWGLLSTWIGSRIEKTRSSKLKFEEIWPIFCTFLESKRFCSSSKAAKFQRIKTQPGDKFWMFLEMIVFSLWLLTIAKQTFWIHKNSPRKCIAWFLSRRLKWLTLASIQLPLFCTLMAPIDHNAELLRLIYIAGHFLGIFEAHSLGS